MLFRRLGNSGLKVSELCLGTLTFGESDRPGNCSEELSHAILDRFTERGGNFIDTADIYGQGASESIVGTWLNKIGSKRNELVIATKGRFKLGREGYINGGCLSRKHLIHAVEESLARLQTDYVDLYQWHCYDKSTPLEESLRTMDDLIRAGKIRYFGVSNFTAWQLQKLMDLSKQLGLVPCISLQQQYSLLNRELELDLVDVCSNEHVAVLPWSPLKGGWLTGKFKRSMKAAPEGTRVQYATAVNLLKESHPTWQKFSDDNLVWDLLDKLEEIAESRQKTVSQVSLKWLLQKRSITSVIIGCKTLAQLEDNMGASDGWELSAQEMNVLDEASQRETPYPNNMINNLNIRFDVYF